MAAKQYKTRPPAYKAKVVVEPYQPDFMVENDMDYTNPYPCGVCGREFSSRYLLRTHKHPNRSTRL